MSVDGTDCEIQEPIPFSPRWYSQKLNCSGLRYEVGISINRGYIVWVNGPYLCGEFTDVDIFRAELKTKLFDGEQVLADKGYTDYRCSLKLPTRTLSESALYRSRHETCNARFKNFFSLSTAFRHPLWKHAHYFHAIANLTQIGILLGSTLFDI